jgi:hypothetical protein
MFINVLYELNLFHKLKLELKSLFISAKSSYYNFNSHLKTFYTKFRFDFICFILH